LFFKISCCAALPSKRLKLKKEGAVQPVGRILSKKQRKRLEKIVDVKKKKENRAQLLKVSTYNS
jgi:ATP-dependent RNA helicase DHX37/DHR1